MSSLCIWGINRNCVGLFTDSEDECVLKAGQSAVRLCKSTVLPCLEPSVSRSLWGQQGAGQDVPAAGGPECYRRLQ